MIMKCNNNKISKQIYDKFNILDVIKILKYKNINFTQEAIVKINSHIYSKQTNLIGKNFPRMKISGPGRFIG